MALASLTQVFAPVHLAKNVFVAVIAGVLLGKATVLFDKSYQVIVPAQPLAVSIVVFPETVMTDGVAVGLVGAGVELIVPLTATFWVVAPVEVRLTLPEILPAAAVADDRT